MQPMEKHRPPWLSWLRKPASHSTGADRRSSPRYPVAEARCRIGWWEGAEFRESPGLLLNLSIRGALLVSDVALAEGTGFWFRLESEAESPWIEARVVIATPTRLGPCRLAVKFRQNCPYETFKLAVFGSHTLSIPAVAELTDEEHEGRDWW